MKYKRCCANLILALLFFVPLMAHAKIVFSLNRKQAGDNAYHIYVMEDDGDNVRRITNPLYYDSYPSWFPDGKQILFERDHSKGAELLRLANSEFYIIDVTGLNEHKFMENHPTDRKPRVSPDGKHIAFVSSRSENTEIHTFNLGSGRLKQLTDDFKERAWSLRFGWSPDSKQIAYEREGRDGQNIWIMNADGSRKRRISPLHNGANILWRNSARWSPSGRYVMYTEKEGKPNWDKIAERLIVQNVRTGVREIYNFPVDSAVVVGCWMGDDHKVLLSIRFDVFAPESGYNIYRYDLGSRRLTNLTNLTKEYAYHPHWIEGTLAVSPLEKLTTQWAELKQTN